MNPEEKKLRALFKKELSSGKEEAPPFEIMWEKSSRSGTKRVWRIAASIALTAVVAWLYLRETNERAPMEIAAWQETTGSLIPSEMVSGAGTLSGWSSPTASLLNEINYNIK